MSANTGVVTYGGLTHEVQQYYDSVTVQLPGTGRTKTTKYAFLARVDPWDDPNTPEDEEKTPPTPPLTPNNIKQVFKNMFVIKRVYPNDMSPMIDRIDWTVNDVYAYYRDDMDILERGTDKKYKHKFYVRNRFDQVFKCLWNNNDSPSTDEPFFAPGQISDNLIYTGLDGYKWIYVYSITGDTKQKFLDTYWMPVPLANTAGYGANTVNAGNIPIVGVYNGGNNYYPSNTTVQIIGANTTTATATPIIQDGIIQDIIITNHGAGYISANVVISSPTGSNANVIAFVSPTNGHGSDPFEEFGTNHIIVTQTFDSNENGLIPTDIRYRQLGFIINPSSPSSFPFQCEDEIYSLSTDIIVSNGPGLYIGEEIVYQSPDDSFANATFYATVLDFIPETNRLRLINTYGTPNTNITIIGQRSEEIRTTLSITNPDFTLFSGYITYIENREGTQRSDDGSEQIRLIVGF
jgi:hypothetical protein